MLAWKSGLSFWIRSLEVPLSGSKNGQLYIWRLSSKHLVFVLIDWLSDWVILTYKTWLKIFVYMYRTLSAAQSRLSWRLNKTPKTTFDSSLHPRRFFQQNWRSCSSDKVGLAECAWTWQYREAYSWSYCSGSANVPGWSWKGEMVKQTYRKDCG